MVFKRGFAATALSLGLCLSAPAAAQSEIPRTWSPVMLDNIAKAKPADYRSATHRIFFAPNQASHIELSVVK